MRGPCVQALPNPEFSARGRRMTGSAAAGCSQAIIKPEQAVAAQAANNWWPAQPACPSPVAGAAFVKPPSPRRRALTVGIASCKGAGSPRRHRMRMQSDLRRRDPLYRQRGQAVIELPPGSCPQCRPRFMHLLPALDRVQEIERVVEAARRPDHGGRRGGGGVHVGMAADTQLGDRPCFPLGRQVFE